MLEIILKIYFLLISFFYILINLFKIFFAVQRTCSTNTDHNNTYFVNPNYPSSDTGYGACTLTINRVNDNICQMRFDFTILQLAQPDETGTCVNDFLTVTGGTTIAPTICGLNFGQHSR